jgi:hypothetical protein
MWKATSRTCPTSSVPAGYQELQDALRTASEVVW